MRTLVHPSLLCVRQQYGRYRHLADTFDTLVSSETSLCRTWLLVVSGEHQSEHITPVLKDLHWLPLSQRVDFKTALMVWKCVHDQVYLSDLCVPANAISGRQHLRSATTDTLLVTRARTATGQRSFAVYGPAT